MIHRHELWFATDAQFRPQTNNRMLDLHSLQPMKCYVAAMQDLWTDAAILFVPRVYYFCK